MKQGEAMSLLKQLLPLAALLLLSIVPTESRVVTSVKDCNEFFLQQTPPNIPGILEGGNIRDQNRYKVICQTLRDIRSFVTLYDTKNRIPVFSAAEYRGGGDGNRSFWKIEPQLENLTGDANMIPADKNITYDHQAGDIDYAKQTEFDRGHLFPSTYRSDVVGKRSTFTLTNAVPQRRRFNNGRWGKMERCVKCILDNYCINKNDKEGFVVIGAQPGNENPLNQRINIPSVLWSAFCCYSHSQNTWLASAHWGKNKDDGPKYLQTKTLGELHTELGIEAFPGTQCPNDTSVTELYSERPCKAQCRQSWNRKKSKSTPPTSTALQIQHLCLLCHMQLTDPSQHHIFLVTRNICPTFPHSSKLQYHIWQANNWPSGYYNQCLLLQLSRFRAHFSKSLE